MGPVAPVGPIAPVEVIVTSSLAAWPVSSFSLLSNSKLAAEADNARPKFEAGVVIQLCTNEVTSSVTDDPNWGS
jgi:hypothetical protein